MSLGRAFAIVSLTGAVSACGSYVARPTALMAYPGPNDDYGVVCVARAELAGTGEAVPVWDNGSLVGANPPKSHFCYRAATGRHVVKSELLVTAELAIDVRANARVWVRQDVDVSSYRMAARASVPRRRSEWVSLTLVAEREGASLLATTVRHQLTEVPTNERLPQGGVVANRGD